MALHLDQLVGSLLLLPKETEWIEFKHNNSNPEEIGEYISALSNSAALLGKEAAYLLWGVEDGTKRLLGTSFAPRLAKVGNEELENWLHRSVHPHVDFAIHEWVHRGVNLVLFSIKPCRHSPVRFKSTEFIRVGSYKKQLKEYPEKERALWLRLSADSFEQGIASEDVTDDDVLQALDYPKLFELLVAPLPTNKTGIVERLRVERLIVPRPAGKFSITNLGALLFARDLRSFTGLRRKALRVVHYAGINRVHPTRERETTKGYAAGFEEIVAYINDSLPANEAIGEALRQNVKIFPQLAVRELVANALIHQDLSLSGTGPMVEIFSDRLEVCNPGQPLIDRHRFIDHSPRSRNEQLADLMRRLRICEERGSGIDKVVSEIELYQLPAPDIRVDETHTRIVLFAPQILSRMDRADKVRACYQHCCLRHVSNHVMTNTSLRERFRIKEEDYPVASRIIRDTVTNKFIKPEDPHSKSRKHAKYVPFWA